MQCDRAADEKLTYQCHSAGRIVSNEGSQTEFCKYLLSAKVDTMILKNEVARMKSELRLTPQVISSLSYEVISQDSALMKHFIGLTTEQFMALHSFLDEMCPLDSIIYWNQQELDGQVTESWPDSKFATQEKLYMSFLRLRRGYTIKSLAVLLSTPDRTIKETQIRRIFTTYIQLMFKVFRDMQDVMFPTRGKLKRYLPKVFKTLKDVRCVVDCTEFRVETSRDYARQGNTYSSYKHTNTFKCLTAVTPN